MISTQSFQLETKGNTDIVDITDKVQSILSKTLLEISERERLSCNKLPDYSSISHEQYFSGKVGKETGGVLTENNLDNQGEVGGRKTTTDKKTPTELKTKEGQVTVFISGSTAGLTTVEYEPGLIQDLKEFYDSIIPQDKTYHHNEKWHDGNGHSHVRASLLKPSLSIPFKDSKLLLGQWQQIILIDFDNKERLREIIVQIQGE